MLIGSQILDITRLWITACLAAIFAPPLVWRLIRSSKHGWRFSFRGVLACITAVAVVFLLLQNDLRNLWWYWKISNCGLSHTEWEIPVMIAFVSSLVTWAATRDEQSEKSVLPTTFDTTAQTDEREPK